MTCEQLLEIAGFIVTVHSNVVTAVFIHYIARIVKAVSHIQELSVYISTNIHGDILGGRSCGGAEARAPAQAPPRTLPDTPPPASTLALGLL